MGLERIIVSAKIEAENRVWLENLRDDFGVRVTVSALIDSLLTLLREESAAGRLDLQDLLRLSRSERRTGLPGKPGLPQVISRNRERA